MDAARAELRDVLHDARSLIALPNNDFAWSSWPSPEAALQEIDGLIVALEGGQSPPQPRMSVLFAPTGPIREVSLSSGWGEQFLALAARFDAAAETFYKRGAWWRRLVIWKSGGA